jgi:hypothetical protein
MTNKCPMTRSQCRTTRRPVEMAQVMIWRNGRPSLGSRSSRWRNDRRRMQSRCLLLASSCDQEQALAPITARPMRPNPGRSFDIGSHSANAKRRKRGSTSACLSRLSHVSRRKLDRSIRSQMNLYESSLRSYVAGEDSPATCQLDIGHLLVIGHWSLNPRDLP